MRWAAEFFNDGYDDVENGIATVLKYDSTQGTWTQVAPMPEARYDAAGCAVGSDIFVFGGLCLCLSISRARCKLSCTNMIQKPTTGVPSILCPALPVDILRVQ
jgi:hypothetical protein